MAKKNKISKIKKDDKNKNVMTTKRRAKVLNKKKTHKKENLNELVNFNINPY